MPGWRGMFGLWPPSRKSPKLHTIHKYLCLTQKPALNQHVWLLFYISSKLKYALGLFFGQNKYGDLDQKYPWNDVYLFSAQIAKGVERYIHGVLSACHSGFYILQKYRVIMRCPGFCLSSILPWQEISNFLIYADFSYPVTVMFAQNQGMMGSCSVRVWLGKICKVFSRTIPHDYFSLVSALRNCHKNNWIVPWCVLPLQYHRTLRACLLFFGTCSNDQSTSRCPLFSLPNIKRSCRSLYVQTSFLPSVTAFTLSPRKPIFYQIPHVVPHVCFYVVRGICRTRSVFAAPLSLGCPSKRSVECSIIGQIFEDMMDPSKT